jgi:hypothetical protein
MSSLPNGDYYRQLSLMAQQKQTLIDHSICLTEAAKYFGMAPKAFIEQLHAIKLIYKPTKHWLGYQDKLNVSLLVKRPVEFSHSNGETSFRSQVKIYQNHHAKRHALAATTLTTRVDRTLGQGSKKPIIKTVMR